MSHPSQDHHGRQEGPHQGHDVIHFQVDREPYTTHAKELTPNDILRDFAGKDVATHYLVQIEPHRKVSFEGKGDIPITMSNGMKFQVIFTGPTPVSDELQ